jgi:uncharacterized protein (DUF488 family)
MYYRRKILLALLETFDGRLEKLQLQKLLLLFTKLQEKPDFHFVPYKYGCFSFQANADLGTLCTYDLVATTESNWTKKTSETYTHTLRKPDLERLRAIQMQYKNKTADELIKATYIKFPYYAIKSKIAHQVLNEAEYAKVTALQPINEIQKLYTIGYEGLSLEEYLNKLLKYDVKVLCDVRKNAFSMKYGFSKSQLKTACEGLGMQYVHLPTLGIDSADRQNLLTTQDRTKLFQQYCAEVLTVTQTAQNQLIELLAQHKRVAITCFEAQSCDCHRHHLAGVISQNSEFQTQHI